MNGIEKKVVEYLERANQVLRHCREDLIIERDYKNDTVQRFEIAKMIQREEQFKLKLAIEHSKAELNPTEIFEELGYKEESKGKEENV